MQAAGVRPAGQAPPILWRMRAHIQAGSHLLGSEENGPRVMSLLVTLPAGRSFGSSVQAISYLPSLPTCTSTTKQLPTPPQARWGLEDGAPRPPALLGHERSAALWLNEVLGTQHCSGCGQMLFSVCAVTNSKG